MTLDATLVKTLGSLSLDMELGVSKGDIVALVGANGAGKSTVLRCLAGLEPLDAGVIRLDGEVLDDPIARVFVSPEARPVGLVFQDYALFPHLSALDNVAFGPQARGQSRSAARATATAWLERVGLADHLHHRPAALSGGQAQRVALVRALATEPALLLLDEPLAALDVTTKSAVRRELRSHLSSVAAVTIIVTHDPVDAYALADRVVIIDEGRVVQSGTLAEITAQPRSRYIADLIGVNLLTVTEADGLVMTDFGGRIVPADRVPGATLAAIQPHAVALYRAHPEGSPRNVWECPVIDIDQRADRVRVRLGGSVPLVAEITLGALGELGLRPGDHVWASVKATEITTYVA
jgi:molybdate transport system ATP-binding protein